MSAVSKIENIYVKAVLAGNNLIITSDYNASINEIKNAVENGQITEEQIDELVQRTLAWKHYKGLLNEETEEINNINEINN